MVWASDLIQVPKQDFLDAVAAFKSTGACCCDTKRRFIVDIPGYPMDIRRCAVCDRSLGGV